MVNTSDFLDAIITPVAGPAFAERLPFPSDALPSEGIECEDGTRIRRSAKPAAFGPNAMVSNKLRGVLPRTGGPVAPSQLSTTNQKTLREAYAARVAGMLVKPEPASWGAWRGDLRLDPRVAQYRNVIDAGRAYSLSDGDWLDAAESARPGDVIDSGAALVLVQEARQSGFRPAGTAHDALVAQLQREERERTAARDRQRAEAARKNAPAILIPSSAKLVVIEVTLPSAMPTHNPADPLYVAFRCERAFAANGKRFTLLTAPASLLGVTYEAVQVAPGVRVVGSEEEVTGITTSALADLLKMNASCDATFVRLICNERAKDPESNRALVEPDFGGTREELAHRLTLAVADIASSISSGQIFYEASPPHESALFRSAQRCIRGLGVRPEEWAARVLPMMKASGREVSYAHGWHSVEVQTATAAKAAQTGENATVRPGELLQPADTTAGEAGDSRMALLAAFAKDKAEVRFNDAKAVIERSPLAPEKWNNLESRRVTECLVSLGFRQAMLRDAAGAPYRAYVRGDEIAEDTAPVAAKPTWQPSASMSKVTMTRVRHGDPAKAAKASKAARISEEEAIASGLALDAAVEVD